MEVVESEVVHRCPAIGGDFVFGLEDMGIEVNSVNVDFGAATIDGVTYHDQMLLLWSLPSILIWDLVRHMSVRVIGLNWKGVRRRSSKSRIVEHVLI